MNKEEILIQFGKNLQRIRSEKNISQEKMTLEIGFDRTYISLLERGKRNPSLITICRLVAYLKVDINQLFKDFDTIMKDFKWQKEEK